MNELVEFLLARLDEDVWWAREASRHAGEEGEPEGNHWQWEETERDRVITLDPSQYEYLGEEYGVYAVSLRSREQYPTSAGPLLNFAISHAEEVLTTVGGHIARHDPARVLAEVEAKRRIIQLAEIAREARNVDPAETIFMDFVLKNLALPYASHPAFKEEWRV